MDQQKFSINLYCEDISDRPKVSAKVRKYIEDFVLENILVKKKIIVNSKWKVVLGISLLDRDYNQDSIDVLPPSTFSDISVKQYTIVVPYKNRLQEGHLSVEFGKYLFEIVSTFLLEYYKRINAEELTQIKTQLDLDYLSSIAYPADFEDQKYIGDNDPNVKNRYTNDA